MDTKLITIFIFSAILGALIVITGCIKVLGKEGVLDMKSAFFVLMGFIFVALPVLGTVSIEWGEFKVLINTTNKEVLELQNTLDSLKVVNRGLQDDLEKLKESVSEYKMALTGPQIAPQQKDLIARQIERQFDNLSAKISEINTSLDSAAAKNSKVRDDLRKFEGRSWYRKPVR
jgi:uncharacterized protein YlxW (UPF0749 family)